MDIINHEDEFKPFDDDRVEFISGLVADVQAIQQSDNLTEREKDILGVAAHNMLVMLSMTLAGYELYTTFRQHAADLYRDAERMTKVVDTVAPKMAPLMPREAVIEYANFINGEMISDDDIG